MANGDTLEWHDGNQPWSQEYQDHYYSRQDGRAECRHVFINGNALPERWKERDNFCIAELGFGTGLNFLETWRLWCIVRTPGQQLAFVSFENRLLEPSDIERATSAWPELQHLLKVLIEAMPAAAGNQAPVQLDPQTSLHIVVDEALEGVRHWPGMADAWYLDGFSPAKNPAMWSQDLMQAVHDHTNTGGTFATYTAAGWIRQNLANAGFKVSRIPGHANKRHMCIGRKEEI